MGKNNMTIDEECRIEREEVKEYFDQYWKHASVLRNWFVAYGIGALALAIYNGGLFSKDRKQKTICCSDCRGDITTSIPYIHK